MTISQNILFEIDTLLSQLDKKDIWSNPLTQKNRKEMKMKKDVNHVRFDPTRSGRLRAGRVRIIGSIVYINGEEEDYSTRRPYMLNQRFYYTQPLKIISQINFGEVTDLSYMYDNLSDEVKEKINSIETMDAA